MRTLNSFSCEICAKHPQKKRRICPKQGIAEVHRYRSAGSTAHLGRRFRALYIKIRALFAGKDEESSFKGVTVGVVRIADRWLYLQFNACVASTCCSDYGGWLWVILCACSTCADNFFHRVCILNAQNIMWACFWKLKTSCRR